MNYMDRIAALIDQVANQPQSIPVSLREHPFAVATAMPQGIVGVALTPGAGYEFDLWPADEVEWEKAPSTSPAGQVLLEPGFQQIALDASALPAGRYRYVVWNRGVPEGWFGNTGEVWIGTPAPLPPLPEDWIQTLPLSAGTLRIVDWNLWIGGGNIADSRRKQVQALSAMTPDVVLLQETMALSALELSTSLGLNLAMTSYDTAVLSRFPLQTLETDTQAYANAALIQTPGGDLLAWSVHLEHSLMPADLVHEDGVEGVSAVDTDAERLRVAQLTQILDETERLIREGQVSSEARVIIGGDYNTVATADRDLGPGKIPVPSTDLVLDHGFLDAFRQVWPSVEESPGWTYSAIVPQEASGHRIDFLMVKGLSAVDAVTVGNDPTGLYANHPEYLVYPGPGGEVPDHFQNSWPSDHGAILADFRL